MRQIAARRQGWGNSALEIEHHDTVTAAAFSPDSARVVTARSDGTAQVWDVLMDPGSLSDWQRRVRRGPFTIEIGVLVSNHSPCP